MEGICVGRALKCDGGCASAGVVQSPLEEGSL